MIAVRFILFCYRPISVVILTIIPLLTVNILLPQNDCRSILFILLQSYLCSYPNNIHVP